MKILIIAGEQSGDVLGAKLIAEIKRQKKDVEFVGIGGKLMREQGLNSLFSIEHLSVMGIFEVAGQIPKILKLIRRTVRYIYKQKPDMVITIDSPDFSFRVIDRLRSASIKRDDGRFLNTKIVHLIAPSVWAYREGRAEKIAGLYDLLLVILPFEPPYFERYGLKTVFVGHPIIENEPDFKNQSKISKAFRKENDLEDDDLILCVMPGSRNGEVKRIFPEFIKAINLLSKDKDNLKVVIPTVPKTADLVKKMSEEIKVKCIFVSQEKKNDALLATNFALVKSGTNSLEISLNRIPMVVAYKFNLLTYLIGRMLVKVKFANLLNLIVDKEIIPEMVHFKCRGQRIYKVLSKLINNKNYAQKQVERASRAMKVLGYGSNEKSTEKSVKEILSLK